MARFYDQFRQVLRRLGKAPLFTAITLMTLAVGIGANTVVFSVVEGVLLKPLDYPHPEQLVGVWHKASGMGLERLPMAAYIYYIDREQSAALQDIGVFNNDSLSVTGEGQPQHLKAFRMTDGVLPILGVKPVLGRLFTRRDDSAGAPPTVLLSYGYWLQRYGGSQSAIGRTIIADGKPREIIGVLPRNFRLPDEDDAALILPMQWDRATTVLGDFDGTAIARLKPGITIAQAQADLTRLVNVANHSFPAPEGFSASLFQEARLQSDLHPLKMDVIGDVGKVLWVLMASIVIVLLVACANVANLLLVRVEGRRQELAIRSALGAGRARITAGLLFESLFLGFAGSLLGLAVAYGALRVLVAMAPTGLPRLHEIAIDLPVLLFTLALALFVGLVIGLVPVIKYARAGLYGGLREGGRALSQGRERHRTRKTLVVVQVALALVLLICSGLMIRTFHALTRVSPGFVDPNAVQTFGLYIPTSQVPNTERVRVVHIQQEILDKIASIPGVSSVAFTTSVPLNGNVMFNPLFAQDHIYKEGELPPMRRFKFISPGFFATMGTPIVAGRDLTWADTYQKRHVAIVSESLARESWHDPANALGRKVRVGTSDDWSEIIGVAADIHDDGVDKPTPAAVYWPVFEDNFQGQKEFVRRGVWFVIRSPRAGSSAFMNEVQHMVWSVDADLPLADPTTLGRLYTKSMARTSFTLVMLSVAGGMALLLGVIGIYGVISYAVSQRTREIGIRMALGAQREQLTQMFVRQGLGLTGVGVAFGLAAAFIVMRLMSSLLFNVSPLDPGTYFVTTAGVLGVAWLACYLPSRRAAAVEPTWALRAE
jgi:putative ABC transport system permease protein